MCLEFACHQKDVVVVKPKRKTALDVMSGNHLLRLRLVAATHVTEQKEGDLLGLGITEKIAESPNEMLITGVTKVSHSFRDDCVIVSSCHGMRDVGVVL